MLLELRDPQGEMRFALYRDERGVRYRDASGAEGRLDPGGHEVRRLPSGALELRNAAGVVLRWARDPNAPAGAEVWRLGDGAGIPLYRVRRQAGEGSVHDAGGMVILRARVAGGRIVVSDRDGRRLALVVTELPPEKAVLAALSSLTARDRALLLAALEAPAQP